MANFCGLVICPVPGPERIKARSVPLKSVSVHADVRGWTAAVTAELEYMNNMDKPIECQFVFPVSDTSAVHRLEADIGGRKLRAECRPRREAEETYQEAVDSGRTGVLLENQSGSPDVFRIMLGNLPAQGAAKITIGFVEPLRRDPDGSLGLTLPAVLNPRYIPQLMFSGAEKMKEHFHFKVPYVPVSDVSYSMSFNAKVNLGVGSSIREVVATNSADTVKVDYENEKQIANVRLSNRFKQDHDFGLNIRPNEPSKPMVYVEPGQQGLGQPNWLNYDIACAWFEPKVHKAEKTGVPGDEYWLVIDRSGSMSGKKIEDAKKALVLFVKSLPVGCKFNIVGFGSRHETLFRDGSVNYSESTIQEAVEHSKRLDANLGGTEILSPLKFIYSKPKPTQPGARKFVILLTDGEVGNTNEVIDLARRNAATTRVFSIGIGEGVSSALVNGLARVSGGVSEFVRNSSDRLQAKVVGLMAAATNPAVGNVAIKWKIAGGKVVSVMPEQVPTAVVKGWPVKQYALIERLHGKSVGGHALLKAEIDGIKVYYKLSISIPSSVHSERNDSMPLHRLAAKARLQELTDNPDYENMEDWCKKLVSISTATSVSCQETAFVAVDLESNDVAKDLNIGKPLFIDIERPSSYCCSQIDMAAINCMEASPLKCYRRGGMGWDGWTDRSLQSNPHARPTGESKAHSGGLKQLIAKLFGTRKVPLESSESRSSCLCSPPPLMPKGVSSRNSFHDFDEVGTVSAMDELVCLQKFDGSWPFSEEVSYSAVSLTTEEMRKRMSSALPANFDDVSMATLVVVAVLRHKYADRSGEWQLIERKAISYLKDKLGLDSAKLGDLIQAVTTAFALA